MAEDSPDLFTQAQQRAAALGESLRARESDLHGHTSVAAALRDAISAASRVHDALDAAVGSHHEPLGREDQRE
jgi:hypothetical protein